MTQLLVDFLGERKARKAMEETWGHLRPPSDHDYPGTLLVSHSEYPDQGVSVVAASFPGVPDSPWFYGALTRWVFEQMTGQREGMRTPPQVSSPRDLRVPGHRAGVEVGGVVPVHRPVDEDEPLSWADPSNETPGSSPGSGRSPERKTQVY